MLLECPANTKQCRTNSELQETIYRCKYLAEWFQVVVAQFVLKLLDVFFD